MPSEKISFLVFADDWGEHPSSCQHIFRHIVKEYPVIWVNTVGMRLPRFCKADLAKGFRKLKRMFFPRREKASRQMLPENLSVIQPPMIPYNKGFFRQINRHSVIKAVRQELKRRGLERPILVTTVPNACDYIGAFGERRVVYYCVDDFANWPGHEKDLILKMEEELIRKSDVFVATSEELFKRLERYQKPIYFLPHGFDFELFHKPILQEPLTLQKIPRPRIGYIGLIDARLNLNLIRHILSNLLNINFVFIGRNEIDMTSIKYSNFYYIPPIDYEQVPSTLQSMDILILPYIVNSFTQTINPLKLKEYLATGKPIVGVPLKEIKKFEPYVVIAETPEEWVKVINDIINRKLCPPKIPHEKLAKEDWSYKAKEFLSFCLP
ncbi:glycosyltransferase family protein [Thermodesulfatator autotrophicus]|uniref:Glycosyltransferase subfamily 4-like N-terminal domain-containing protein n=1 Tax=Thermodesulfatator autotrophicus TaxID=1795632 RepID=A0A177E7U3_9BACT|nr:glycosyltransferase [Thermodesulfatator autotrophicus]OAG28023.1 hypothetical protein TH606_04085 [Thermodesulfatator autotrophicus]